MCNEKIFPLFIGETHVLLQKKEKGNKEKSDMSFERLQRVSQNSTHLGYMV